MLTCGVVITSGGLRLFALIRPLYISVHIIIAG